MNNHMHRELAELHAEIARLGGMVEDSIGKAMTSLYEGDQQLARQVRSGDDLIDELEVKIEEHLLSIMALYQPVARDLRFLVTALKVNNELEHIGDLAESIARKAFTIPKSKVDHSKIELRDMAEITQQMLSEALTAFLEQDGDKAKAVLIKDDKVDRWHGKNHRTVAENIEKTDRDFTVAELQLLSVSRSLERIADTASSIAEDVVYLVDAQIIRHRPYEID